MENMLIWVNNNAGLITLVQTAITLFLSIFAVGVTIHFSRLQYKKEIRVYTGLFLDKSSNYNLELWIYNIGNVPIYIKDIQVVEDNGQEKESRRLALGSKYLLNSEESFLVPKMASEFNIPLINADLSSPERSPTMKIIIDTEEKTFYHRINWALG